MLLKLTVVLSIVLACLAKDYFWVQDDQLFDCIVFIEDVSSKYSKPTVCQGVFIRKNLIVTSFNPLYATGQYRTAYYFNLNRVDTVYDKSQSSLGKDVFYDEKFNRWVYWESGTYDNNPAHDLVFFRTDFDVVDLTTAVEEPDIRRPLYLPVAKKYAIEEPMDWSTAAYALVDKKHVNESNRLISIYYTEPVLVDCEEWFPKYWGFFICIMNLDHYPVIQSGAPLIQNLQMFGIASFTMKKGKESIFAFTDLRPYRDLIYNDLPKIYSG